MHASFVSWPKASNVGTAGFIMAPAIVHLIIHWDWVERTATRFFTKILHTSRANLAVDTVMFLSLTVVSLSGVMVMPELRVASGGAVSRLWLLTHNVSADVLMYTLIVHLSLHARWIVRLVGGMFAQNPSRAAERTTG